MTFNLIRRTIEHAFAREEPTLWWSGHSCGGCWSCPTCCRTGFGGLSSTSVVKWRSIGDITDFASGIIKMRYLESWVCVQKVSFQELLSVAEFAWGSVGSWTRCGSVIGAAVATSGSRICFISHAARRLAQTAHVFHAFVWDTINLSIRSGSRQVPRVPQGIVKPCARAPIGSQGIPQVRSTVDPISINCCFLVIGSRPRIRILDIDTQRRLHISVSPVHACFSTVFPNVVIRNCVHGWTRVVWILTERNCGHVHFPEMLAAQTKWVNVVFGLVRFATRRSNFKIWF
mgnify:CR=1 FL=1